ncbi:hypothetical protein [Streptacidiphilus sp. MAP12-20]|uniref:hypothetical protein n=1 Tax=Streptacidiphilus sp. MAP12-20 TaxID=3156299 RepID=UPI00351514C2
MAQVAASALAAVVGAVLASQLGVYGTILGAAVVSVGATTGGALFQHLFRRTGEQLREMSSGAALVEPSHPAEPVEERASERTGEKTQVFDPFDPGGERTRMMARINPPESAEAVAVYRGRNTWKPKSWKVYAVTATLVFALAMGTVGVMELVVGKPAGQWGGSSGRSNSGTSAPADPSGGGQGTGGQSTGGRSSNGSDSKQQGAATPSTSPSSKPSASPSPSTSPSTDTTPPPTTPSGSPSSGSGSGAGSGSGTSGDAATPKVTPSP